MCLAVLDDGDRAKPSLSILDRHGTADSRREILLLLVLWRVANQLIGAYRHLL